MLNHLLSVKFHSLPLSSWDFPGGSVSKESACKARDLGWVRRIGVGNGSPLQYLTWEIPWTEEPGDDVARVGHDRVTKLQLLPSR